MLGNAGPSNNLRSHSNSSVILHLLLGIPNCITYMPPRDSTTPAKVSYHGSGYLFAVSLT